MAIDARPIPRFTAPDPYRSPHPFAWTLEQSTESSFITDINGVIEYVNAAFETLTGYARTEAIGRTPSILKSASQSAGTFRRLWDTLHAAEEFRGILVNRKKNGDLFREEKVIRPLFDATGQMTHFLSEGRDVNKRARDFEKLAYAATHDSLTGLPNRQVFFDRLGQAMRHSARSGKPFAVAIVDVDRFKAVNDTFGHAIGDAVLCAVASRLVRCVRDADTVARLGGDEFAVLLLDTADGPRMASVLQHVVDAFVTPIPVALASVPVTISLGASLFPADADRADALMKCADEEMYRAKRAGGSASRMSGNGPEHALRRLAGPAPHPVPLPAQADGRSGDAPACPDRKIVRLR
jgi:diguanylate cyclase (GGDEF)-like protein/PAS domain S-box-containing protein